ncbi:MAG: inorganic phosphate transporter [Methanomicrobiales archaeon]|nr:inorganic phosphate transporter [Methanomicrobiales archaeon]
MNPSDFLIPGILIALLFNFVSGLNGAANSIATVIATRALSPFRAITLAAACNVIGPFLFTTAIAHTLGSGLLQQSQITPLLLFIAIIVAATLVIIATLSGLPISSSHALIGGLIGAGFAAEGTGILILPEMKTLQVLLFTVILGIGAGSVGLVLLTSLMGIEPDTRVALMGALFWISIAIPLMMFSGILHLSGITAIIIFIIISPVLGFMGAFTCDLTILYLFRRSRMDIRRRIFTPLQVLATAFQALGHGAHDGQLAAGIIVAFFISMGLMTSFFVPLWVTLATAGAIGLGTLFGGWRVVERMGKKITRLRPYQGFAASTSAGLIISSLTSVGIPISTTHVIGGTIVGVGATRGRAAVQWEAVRIIIAGWLITLPLAFILSWLLYTTIQFL